MRRYRLVAVALAAVALAGCTGGGSSGQANVSYIQGKGTVAKVLPDKRGEPITLAGETLESERLDLATMRGKPVVINVWASWCPPCREEADDLKAAATELAPSGVKFVGINTRDENAQARAYERNAGTPYPSLVDTGDLLLAFRGNVPPSALPTTLVLDGQGRIAVRVSGAVTQRTLVGLVKDVLAES